MDAYSDDALHISRTLSLGIADSLPPVHVDQPSNPFDIEDPSALDLRELVNLQFAHQTKQAATGVKTHSCSNTTNSDSSSPGEVTGRRSVKPTERQELLRRFTEIIKQQGDRGIGTGLERSARWQKVTNQTRSASSASGNAKNAAITAKAAATKVHIRFYGVCRSGLRLTYQQLLNRRKQIFKAYSLPDIFGDARITVTCPLQVGDIVGGYGFALSSYDKLDLVVCKGEFQDQSNSRC